MREVFKEASGAYDWVLDIVFGRNASSEVYEDIKDAHKRHQ